ncbi:MAG TPA: isocitrate/isopropylmalate dehydrogenase family protein [Methanothrix sp.]|nr:isocitrate/isopropylmalate dehydrogenase family protein [Methanothrix sp.]
MSGRGAEKRVALVKGDGVGPEVIDGALTVLAAAGADLELVPVELGYGRWKRTGRAMADEDLELIKTCRCVLFGAITTPPDPDYRSVLLALRKGLDLYANIRPFSAPGLDFVIVRENTEGMYSGVEKLDEEEATTLRVITSRGSLRIAEMACSIASKRERLAIVHKSNVLKSDTLFLRICRETASRWGVPFEDMLVDAAGYNLVVNPKRFDVMVTTNLFGDILSDVAAGVVGSLGLCPSANLGDRYALFEPIHGSAPDIAGRGIANPIGAIRSAAMMLEWLGDFGKARMIEEAVTWALARGIRTPDLGGSSSTKEMACAIADRLARAD